MEKTEIYDEGFLLNTYIQKLLNAIHFVFSYANETTLYEFLGNLQLTICV